MDGDPGDDAARGAGLPGPTAPSRRRVLVWLGAGVASVAVGGGAVALATRPSGRATASPPPAAPPTSLGATPATLPALPVPEQLPEDAYAPTPQVVIGTIAIDRIGLVADVQEGITLTAINRGPGHWPGTAMPGELGNVVVAGHRTTYSKPFAHLDELQPGDPVVLTTAGGRFTYAVRGIVIVPGEAIDIAEQSYAHTATLFACHPPGSARERIVAKLRLLATDGSPVDPDSALPPLDAGAQETDHTLVMRARDPLSAAAG